MTDAYSNAVVLYFVFSGGLYLYFENCISIHFPVHDTCGEGSAVLGVTGPVKNPHRKYLSAIDNQRSTC